MNPDEEVTPKSDEATTTPEWEKLTEAIAIGDLKGKIWTIPEPPPEKQRRDNRVSALWDARRLLEPYYPESPESRIARPIVNDLIALADFIVNEAQTFEEEEVTFPVIIDSRRCRFCGQIHS